MKGTLAVVLLSIVSCLLVGMTSPLQRSLRFGRRSFAAAEFARATSRSRRRHFGSFGSESGGTSGSASGPPIGPSVSSIGWAFEYTPPTPKFTKSNNAFLPRKVGQKTFALGDIHGDVGKLVAALRASELVEVADSGGSNPTVDDLMWAGGDSILVQVGDVVDRGSTEVVCLHLLSRLSRQAAEAGGGVVLCLGNHEILNTLGLFNYADRGGNEEFESVFGPLFDKDNDDENGNGNGNGNGREPSWRLHYAGNEPARWRCYEPGGLFTSFNLLNNCVLGTQVGRSVFVHAGLTKQHLEDHGGIQGMNDSARKWLESAVYTPPHTSREKLSRSKEDIISCAQNRARSISSAMPEFLSGGPTDRASPVWMRDYSKPPDVTPANASATPLALEALSYIGNGASRFVVGHTPQTCINSSCQGMVWRIDVGMSAGVLDNAPEVLEIVHGEESDEIFVIRAGVSDRISASQRKCRAG